LPCDYRRHRHCRLAGPGSAPGPARRPALVDPALGPAVPAALCLAGLVDPVGRAVPAPAALATVVPDVVPVGPPADCPAPRSVRFAGVAACVPEPIQV